MFEKSVRGVKSNFPLIPFLDVNIIIGWLQVNNRKTVIALGMIKKIDDQRKRIAIFLIIVFMP